MPLLLTCPHGHQWEWCWDKSAQQTPSSCPVCGGAGSSEETFVPEEWPKLHGDLPPVPRLAPLPAGPNLGATARSQVRFPNVAGYEIVHELGRGGMGIVYQARQQNLGRLVALKMLRPDSGAGAEELARFRREAEAVAALRHTNFVQIYDIGTQDGRPYFVLEYVDGGSLASRLAQGPLPPIEAAALLEALARAMHCAHQCGIIHRDLKPSNILMMADGTPKIADFGLAKKVDALSSETRTGAILGTPSYMAPEQALARTKEVGPATDIHALGAILYESLTCRPPFRAETLLETLNQVASQAPAPPRSIRPDIPTELETICLRCLEKDPARRYASAADLAEALSRHRCGAPIQEKTLLLPQSSST